MSKLWNRERVIREIQARHQAGLPLMFVWRDWPGLYSAAQKYCGSWREAVEATGFQPRIYRRWNKQRVIQEIQAWHRAPPSDVDDWDQGLVSAATRFFGSWKQALEAAGLEPRRHRKWNRQRVIEAIQDRHIRGRSINGIERRNRSLVWAARHYCGGWQQALEAAGLRDQFQLKRAPRPWSCEFMIAEIREFHARGLPVAKVWQKDPTLYAAAKDYYGSWRAAVTAAGFAPAKRRWSHEAVLAEIQARQREGKSLNCHDLENRNLAAVAYRYFGGWRKALDAAGVATNLPRKEGPCHAKR